MIRRWMILFLAFPAVVLSANHEVLVGWGEVENKTTGRAAEFEASTAKAGVSGRVEANSGAKEWAGSDDGTYGIDVKGAPKVRSGTIKLRSGRSKSVRVVIENEDLKKISLDAFCFDYLRRNDDGGGPDTVVLAYLKGGLGIPDGTVLFRQSGIPVGAKGTEYDDYLDFTIPLASFGDVSLGRGQSAYFEISGEGGDSKVAGLLDNIGIVSGSSFVASAPSGGSKATSIESTGIKPISIAVKSGDGAPVSVASKIATPIAATPLVAKPLVVKPTELKPVAPIVATPVESKPAVAKPVAPIVATPVGSKPVVSLAAKPVAVESSVEKPAAKPVVSESMAPSKVVAPIVAKPMSPNSVVAEKSADQSQSDRVASGGKKSGAGAEKGLLGGVPVASVGIVVLLLLFRPRRA